MFYQKTGFPEEGELVLCKVSTVQYNSVFATLLEFVHHPQGMIHISEVSPGRIRNIRDYVKEDKVVVCKVLRINRERRHIDLSLRRVSDFQRRQKVNEIKQEQMAEKILEFLSKKHKQEPKVLFDTIMGAIGEDYDGLYPFFETLVEEDDGLSALKLDDKIKSDLLEVVRQRIKPQEVTIAGTISLESFAPNGVEVVKEALQHITKTGGDALYLVYAGAGNFNFIITAPDYKEAERILAAITKDAEKYMQKKNSAITIVRKEK